MCSLAQRGPTGKHEQPPKALGSAANRTRKRLGYVHGAWAHGKRKPSPVLLSAYRLALSWPILQRVRDTLMLRRALLVTAPIVRPAGGRVLNTLAHRAQTLTGAG